MSAHRHLLLSVIRPSIEYGSEVWEGNKSQAGSLESIILDGAKWILGCSSKTCNEAVRGDMGLDTLQSCRDRAKLKWWYKLATLPEWNSKPRRGRHAQRKVWSRMVDYLKSLDIDTSEWLEDIKHGDSSSASYTACVEECISERESRKFEEGLNTKVKLGMYKRFGQSVEFKKYLHGIRDAGSRLSKFRSGTHGLNEELGSHRGREGKTECSLCRNECENVSHVLWECSAYSSIRASFMKTLQELLEDDYEDFGSLEIVEKSSYVLGSELWESKFDGLLAVVKVVDVWEIRKHKLYDSDSGSGLQLHTQSSPGERSGKFSQNGKFDQNGKFSQNGKFGQSGMSGQKGKVNLGPNVSSSAHYHGCVVNGSGAMAAIFSPSV